MDFSNPLAYGVPCFIALILLEIAYSHHNNQKDLYAWKDLMASGSLGVGTAILSPLLQVVFMIVLFEGVYAIFNPVINGENMNIFGYESFGYEWYIWALCMLGDDFAYYWYHRANHEIRILWAAHIVHHSSDHFNLGTGVRNGFFTHFYKPFFYIWLPAVGFPVEMIMVCIGIESLWQFQLHSQYIPKMGFLEKFLNTHTMHQVHHSQNLEYMDKNHGGILNIFDRIFGTWKELDNKIDTKYGVTHPPNSYNPVIILTHEFKDIWKDVRKANSFKEKFMYIFGPPGWSHDGSTLTVKQQQRLLKNKKAGQLSK
ncbi:sterol desaturase family protein [Gramella sp. GC03-9]|uniref:Sterol desaturase family protein n=1 Tax=Christiangramia oceanisediminis TaxID=2920386 RepID=A0A9X2I1F8_9FLAO|nr:sterol desaturase family protein [Gramella oceanisediminis]MCP9198890.1 sterol desaturase family protein [Gramella oceanisediminis]